MSKQDRRGPNASAYTVRPRPEHEANGTHESVSSPPATNGPRTPRYDTELRELRIEDRIVKRLTQKSDAQEIILLAFQEESWPHRIDDPLAVKDEQEPKRRLGMAVANLNRRQREPLIQFGVALQGTAVTWRFREERQ